MDADQRAVRPEPGADPGHGLRARWRRLGVVAAVRGLALALIALVSAAHPSTSQSPDPEARSRFVEAKKAFEAAAADPAKVADGTFEQRARELLEHVEEVGTPEERVWFSDVMGFFEAKRAFQEAADDPDKIADGTFEKRTREFRVHLEKRGAPAEHAWFAEFLGFVALQFNRPDLGQPYLEAALKDARIPRANVPQLWFYLGQIHFAAGRMQEARIAYARAEAALAEAGPDDGSRSEFLRELYSWRGVAERRLGLLGRAARSFQAESSLAARAEPEAAAVARLHLIDLRSALEEFDEALRLAREGLDEVDRRASTGKSLTGDDLLRARLMLRQGMALSERARGTDNWDEARQHVEESLDALRRVNAGVEEILTGELVLVDIGLRAHHEARVREALTRARALAQDPAQARLDLRARLAAFEVAAEIDFGEGSRLPQLRDTLRSLLEAWLLEWEREPVQRDGVGFLHWGAQRLLFSESIRAELATGDEATKDARALAVLLRAQQLGTLSRSLGLSAPDPESLRARLAQIETGALVFLPAMERTHAFVIDERGIKHYQLASRDALLKAGDALMRRMLVAPGSDDPKQRADALEEARKELSKLVLEDKLAARISTWKRCLCVGSELISSVPVDVLTFPDGRELGLEMSISHLPSLAIALELLQRAETRSSLPAELAVSVLVAAEPSSAARRISPQLASIPLDSDELEELLSEIPEERVWCAPESATMELLTDARIATSERLVLFAHGLYDPASDHPAQLALQAGSSDDGIASALFIADPARSWPMEVLLLACGTARGSSRLGDDTATHLGSAFLERNANVVLVSRGDLDLSTAKAFARAYLERAIVHGEDAGEAMRLARRKLAARPETADLARRGLLMLYGVSAPRKSDPAATEVRTAGSEEPAVLPVIIVAAILAVALFAWVRRRRPQITGRRSR